MNSTPISSAKPESPSRRDKRSRIINAAIRVFARSGFHAARVSDIAAEAGIAYGLVYHYFKNKEEILNTIFEERWSGFLETVETIADSPETTEQKLLGVARLILGAYYVHPEWVKVLVLDIQRSSRFRERGQIRSVGRLFQLIARILREGQAKGEVRRDVDPDVACYIVIGGLETIVTGLVLDVIEIEADQAENEYYLKAAETVAEILLRGLAADVRDRWGNA